MATGVLDQTAEWDRVKNTQGFSTGSTSSLGTVPTTLPSSGVAFSASPPNLDYLVRFTLADGTVETVGRASLFALSGFSVDDEQTLNIGSQSSGAGAGKVTFDPLTLTFSQPELTPLLLQMLASGTPFQQIDVLGYTVGGGPNGGHLVTDESFGLVAASSLALSDGTATTVSFEYGSQAMASRDQNLDGSFGSSSTTSWDRVLNVSGFSTGASQANPFQVPSALLTETQPVQEADGGTLSYYVQFTKQDGSILRLNNDQLFKLASFSFDDQQTLNIGSQSTGAGAGKVTFDPLSLNFANADLSTLLFQMLAAGTTFREVDVLGYVTQQAGQGALAQAYSFGLVAAADLQTGNADPTQLALQYGSEAVRTYSVACYCAGTRITTADGERSVEDLAIGDLLQTVSGQVRPIRWIGRRSYAGRFLRGKPEMLPVCFKAGSIDDGVPSRDLWVSPKHAMFLDGALIPAEHLVNGLSVVQPGRAEGVSYFHVELDSHDLIQAEGAWSETFVDDDSRGMFHNAAEFSALYPGSRASPATYCAPRLDQGFGLEAVRCRIALRAGVLVLSLAA